MNQSKIAVRYAKALFQFATEKNMLDEIKLDIALIAETARQKEFILLLESPVIQISKKKSVFSAMFGQQINKVSMQFLLMIIENKRDIYIPGICRNFLDQYRLFKGIKEAKITTAIPLDDLLTEKIKNTMAQLFSSKIELTSDVNPDLIGGFILRVGDQQMDTSIANKLKSVERSFLNTTI